VRDGPETQRPTSVRRARVPADAPYTRPTADVDLFVRPKSGNIERLKQALAERYGFGRD
jgi:hypothetical protein